MEMNPAKYLTAGPVPGAKAPRLVLKDQEVTQLLERAEDLETSISVNMQLMHEIASARPLRSGEDTESAAHFPGKLYEKLLEQKVRLEAAIEHTRAQKTLCCMKISRSESEAKAAQQSEARVHTDCLANIARARQLLEDKEATAQELEAAHTQLEAELKLCQGSKLTVADLPGTALRIERLTRAVRQDEQFTQAEKIELLDRCKVRSP